MKRITFISAVVATVFMFLALGPTKAQALVNCEDMIFPSGSELAFYRCDERDQDGDTNNFCTTFEQGGTLSFNWFLDEGDSVDCQCRKTFLGFETNAWEFLCTGREEEDEEVMALAGRILWIGGPILAEGVEVPMDPSADAGGFILKCRPDPSCD
jgi:hypothetical protein